MTIAIVDYGVGNLFSLRSSFAFIGHESVVTGDAETIHRAEKIILPGVGAFADAAEKLRTTQLDQIILDEVQSGKPLLGICLGMQLLLDRSFEFETSKGLGLIHGDVVPIRPVVSEKIKVPQIGWNALRFPEGPKHPIFNRTRPGDFVYFVHSYYADAFPDSVIATTEYEAVLTAAVARENVCGVQFHPEKSGEVGLNILRAFCEM